MFKKGPCWCWATDKFQEIVWRCLLDQAKLFGAVAYTVCCNLFDKFM